MNAYQDRRDRTRVDELLDESGMTAAEQAALRALLAPVAAPARVGELRGEMAALAAFRGARPVLPAQSSAIRSGPALKRGFAPAMSIKAAVAALTVLGMGGVAVAASTGTLPGPLDGLRDKPAKVQPTEQPPTPGLPAGDGSEAPAPVPPGRTVSENTKGAEQSQAVRERNAQRRLDQRERLLAEREERLARQERRRAEQAAGAAGRAADQRKLTESQAQREAQQPRAAQPERPAPRTPGNANR